MTDTLPAGGPLRALPTNEEASAALSRTGMAALLSSLQGLDTAISERLALAEAYQGHQDALQGVLDEAGEAGVESYDRRSHLVALELDTLYRRRRRKLRELASGGLPVNRWTARSGYLLHLGGVEDGHREEYVLQILPKYRWARSYIVTGERAEISARRIRYAREYRASARKAAVLASALLGLVSAVALLSLAEAIASILLALTFVVVLLALLASLPDGLHFLCGRLTNGMPLPPFREVSPSTGDRRPFGKRAEKVRKESPARSVTSVGRTE